MSNRMKFVAMKPGNKLALISVPLTQSTKGNHKRYRHRVVYAMGNQGFVPFNRVSPSIRKQFKKEKVKCERWTA